MFSTFISCQITSGFQKTSSTFDERIQEKLT